MRAMLCDHCFKLINGTFYAIQHCEFANGDATPIGKPEHLHAWCVAEWMAAYDSTPDPRED